MNNNRKNSIFILLITLYLIIALTACGQENDNTGDLIPDETDNSLNVSEVEDSSEEDQEQEQEEEQAEIVEVVSGCVECHSDQQQLIDTAGPEEEHESENEGVG